MTTKLGEDTLLYNYSAVTPFLWYSEAGTKIFSVGASVTK